jgi:Zn-dependent M28 family amino/carboxypeptidase
MSMWNIVGTQNWEKAKTRVVLFAHWDTRPTADQEQDPQNQLKPIMGANDGASGVAVLLELARVMKKSIPTDLGIQYVLTDGEDVGPDLSDMFLGAKVYAKTLSSQKADYGILLDMIGDADLKVPMEPNSMRFAGSLVRDFYAHANKINLGSTFTRVLGPTIEDDHIPINEAGLPTMDLIDFSYEPWHTLQDTPDKCSPNSLGKIGKMLQSWLLQNPVYKFKKSE